MNDIFITSLRINELRHLKNIEINLSQDHKKHLILTGKNGSGKTSVLETLITLLRNDESNESKGKSVECEFHSFEDWREKLRQSEVVVAFRKAKDLTAMYDLSQTPTALFQQYLVNLQAERTLARDAGEPEIVAEIDQRFTMFEKILREVFEDETLQLQFDSKNSQFSIITKNREPFDFSTLSDGYAAVVWIFCDVILRMAKKRGESYDMQGIVLIDDLETYLDVDLQGKILPLLTSFFPNIQFIVSTHSPVVPNSLGNAVIYDLENRIRRQTPSNYVYKAFMKRHADIGQYSDQIKRVIDEYEKLLSKNQKTDQEEFRVLELRHYLTWIIHKLL
jgi:predicted ATP-binding protein involved in virulence